MFHKQKHFYLKSHHSFVVESFRCISFEESFFCVLATSLMEFRVFENQVFFDAWISVTAVVSWCVKSCVLHSDSTNASFVCANSNSNSLMFFSKSRILGFKLSGSTFGSGIRTVPSGSNNLLQFSQVLTWSWKNVKHFYNKCIQFFLQLHSLSLALKLTKQNLA